MGLAPTFRGLMMNTSRAVSPPSLLADQDRPGISDATTVSGDGLKASGLAARALDLGLDALDEAEILELFLDRAGVIGADALARALLGRFGGLAAVLGAPFPMLAAVAQGAALDLRLLHEATVRVCLAPLRQREVLGSWSAVTTYLKVLLAAQPREQVWVLFLDRKNQLLLSEKISEGTVDHAPVYPREIVRRALELNSSALILVHNHPSGDPTPSGADVSMTREVVQACGALKIAVHDHMIVGRDHVASMKALGLI